MKHLIFSSKLFALLFVISTMMYVGCQKDDIKSGDSVSIIKTEIRSIRVDRLRLTII